MKIKHLIFLSFFSIALSSCSFEKVKNLFREEDKDLKIRPKAETKTEICPATNIPYETSFYIKKSYSTGYTAKIKKISTNCKFISIKNAAYKKQILISFKADIEIQSRKSLNNKSNEKLYLYIAMVDNKGKILAKVLSPIYLKDIEEKGKYNYEIIEENKFKYTFDKINENFTVYYGFQKKRLK